MSKITWNRKRPVVIGSLRWVPIEALASLESTKESCTFSNASYWKAVQSGVPRHQIKVDPYVFTFQLDEDLGYIGVPRHVPLVWKKGGSPPVVDRRGLFERGVEQPTHGIKLRNEMQEEASAALQNGNGDKIISVGCGGGKTTISLFAASEGKRAPILVIVNTNALMDQWLERIKEFYGPETRVGRVQGSVCTWKDRQISVAMLHTLVQREYPPEFYAYWRLVITDEVHRVGASTFSRSASMFACERWGLSATVSREDGMDAVFRAHLGEIKYLNLAQPLVPKIYFVDTGIRAESARFLNRGGTVNNARLLSFLSDNVVRNKAILYWLRRAALDGRKVLVLCERLSQAWALADYLKVDNIDASVFVGTMKSGEKAESLKSQVIVATQHIAREGLDRPDLDTLFITVPCRGPSRVQQSIGRILREVPGKKTPKVLVFQDDCTIVQSMSRKMQSVLRNMGYAWSRVHAEVAQEGENHDPRVRPHYSGLHGQPALPGNAPPLSLPSDA